MRRTLREHQLDCSHCKGNDVVLHELEAVDVFVDAAFAQTHLATIAELLDGIITI
jgi:hypothetical protein